MKKFLSLVVAALLSVSAVATTATAAFTDVDVKDEALTDAVELLTALNVTKGTTETTFGTAENVTRQQMAAFIYRMMKAGKSVEGGTNTTSFADLDDPTYYFMVSWANSQGIIKGRSATSFDPKGGITLQDAYTMVVRALGYDDGTLAYPIGYISKAEDLGLDADLPATLNYTDTLTRGNVAIILANMFYAETADVEIKYEATWKFVCPAHGQNTDECGDGTPNCNPQAVSNGQVPKEYHKTVAEAIFEVEKISQRVVATPNYSFNDAEKPDEDVPMVMLVDDYADAEEYDTDIEDLGLREFSDLGLEGNPDDYFLSDIIMFVKDVDGEYEIFGATAAGTKTTVGFDKVEFGTVSGTKIDNYYDGSAKEYKYINGKLTLDGTVTYLFDAPYSFAKNKDTQKYNAQFIELSTYDGDMESEDEADHIKFNYVLSDVDAEDLKQGIIGTYTPAEGDDEYADDYVPAYWTYNGYLSQVYFGGLGEIDVYDCDGNGKPDYLFVKNFTVGTIDTEEEAALADAYEEGVDAEETIIYTDTAITEGEFADKDMVLAYVNVDANYVKVAEVLTGKDASIKAYTNKYLTLSTDEKVYFKDIVATVKNGEANLGDLNADIDFDSEATYYFAANGKLVYVANLSTATNLNENYVVVLSKNVFTTTTLVDGKLQTADYIDIYNDGEIKSVKAKKITADLNVYDEFETPVNYFIDEETNEGYYDYSKYVDQLATGKVDKKGAYYFQLIDFVNFENEDLTDKEEETNEVRAQADGVEFAQYKNNIYTLSTESLRGVYIRDYTQIIIRSKDEDGEWIVTAYGADNLPDIKEGTEFDNVSYILVNNVNSSSYENLAVFYGVLDAELEGDLGEVAELRVVRGFSMSQTEDGKAYYYDVFNPFKGTVETAVQGTETDLEKSPFVKGSIVGLTTENYVDETTTNLGNAYGKGVIYDTDVKYDNISGLGYVEIAEYDESTGYLEIVGDETLYQVTDKTVLTFSDKSDESFKTVDASVLASTAKTYREAEDKNNALRVFLCVEEGEDSDDEDKYYDVLFAMVVRN